MIIARRKTPNNRHAKSQTSPGLRWHGVFRMAGAARGCHHPGNVSCSYWTSDGRKSPAPGSGRTDAGVHALGQVASFVTQSPIPPENLVVALNDILPSTIRVQEAVEVRPNFTPASPPGPRPTATACFVRHLSAFCGTVRVALSLSFGRSSDAGGSTVDGGRARFHLVRRG